MKYNLSMYQIGLRYVIAIILIIPIIMTQHIYLVLVPIYLIVTALLGMCPIKALITSAKSKVKH